ncbi:uncharacterized protein BO96DRAFT_428496 [Aspergillus niger CBS 101883]|uniref:Uncharacterized protein n=3 Tax=Aspergillus niger TaxID=5061 RepID=A2QE78_ASPNC|nr:uncharacterized protein BO96DRAFT_428496 [Aspergillus niger CBS 101883]XP_059600065.1 hypothetical protein An02g09700 [Aspergillus niger]PYH61724.1 hypothetical protein BO96DRAFT_428496 [Aspergillus niger CBS 101883]RDH23023.1 hypothetical protein M747DRAFT_313072 [Aspergillus niger ATCC 13496]CAK37839.1 hypothetical protein An02g09700 [Aspergillus niger]
MRGTTVLKAQPPYDNTLLIGLSAEVWSYRVIGHSWHNDLMRELYGAFRKVISRDGWMSTIHGVLVATLERIADAIQRGVVKDGNSRRNTREKRDMRIASPLVPKIGSISDSTRLWSLTQASFVIMTDEQSFACRGHVEKGVMNYGVLSDKHMSWAGSILNGPDSERPIQHRWCKAEGGGCESFPWPSHALTGASGIFVEQTHHWHCNGNTFSWLVVLISKYCHYRHFSSKALL